MAYEVQSAGPGIKGEMVPKGFVDIPEHRFPLNLTAHIPAVAEIWTQAKASSWDPQRDIPWDAFDPSPYTEEQLFAARVFWSRRAWSEYTGLAESPTVLLRFAFQGQLEPEIKFVLASKLMDEAKHCEASFLMAERLGGYLPEPPSDAPRRRVMSGLRDVGMEPTYCPEAVLASWHCVSDGVAVRRSGWGHCGRDSAGARAGHGSVHGHPAPRTTIRRASNPRYTWSAQITPRATRG